MLLYQEKGRYFGQIADGLEDLGLREIEKLGGTELQPVYRGIWFNADQESLYRINYNVRLVSRVLAPIARFKCRTPDDIRRRAARVPWDMVLGPGHTFAVFAQAVNSPINHSHHAALCLKDGLVDYFRETKGKRPDVETRAPDVWLNLHIHKETAMIHVDTSGGSLHRRGYRLETVEAPMQETVAAAIIALSEWDGEKPLYDPMCGSGTLLCEALLSYCRIPAGYLRSRFGFELLPDYSQKRWNKVRKESDSQIRELPDDLIQGSDLLPGAVAAARKNLSALPMGHKVRVSVQDLHAIEDLSHRVIVSNPPYGIRLRKKETMAGFYRSFGDFLKQRAKGSTAYLYFGDRQWIKHIGLKTSFKRPLRHGGLDGRLVRLDMY